MSTAPTAFPTQREPELLGQSVVVIGGSAGIGSSGVQITALVGEVEYGARPVTVFPPHTRQHRFESN